MIGLVIRMFFYALCLNQNKMKNGCGSNELEAGEMQNKSSSWDAIIQNLNSSANPNPNSQQRCIPSFLVLSLLLPPY